MKNECDVAVIGGGAAGLLAGIAAARAGAQTRVFERGPEPGRKIALSGGGRCNFTNTLAPRDFVRLFGDKNAHRLGEALRVFSREDLLALLAAHGVEGAVERAYRIYAKSGRGRDVAGALADELQKAGGILAPNTRIFELRREADKNRHVLATSETAGPSVVFSAKTVVLCTGGMSYPETGSTGDGYAWARAFGHQVTGLRAALVGLVVAEKWAHELQGLACPDVKASLYPAPNGRAQGRPLAAERGEFLFTHFGVSGPAILDLSNSLVAAPAGLALLTLDFFPALRREELDSQICTRFKAYPQRLPIHALQGLLPPRLLEHFIQSLGPATQKPAGQISRETRALLLNLFKTAALAVTGTRGIEHGEVTAGGVSWEQLDPATLESKLSPGLFFAGEILDVAGRCGGFNLQAAFSTGYLAGRSAARRASLAA
jgi:predicted Rossmann fold flavoprotein